MTKKRKLSDVAKDLQMEAAELIAFFESIDSEGQKKKKAGSGLTEAEINTALEHFTQKQQTDSFDEYFATRTLPRSAFEKKPKTDEKKQEKRSMKKTEKKTEEAAETKNSPKKNKAEKKSEKPAVKKENNKPAVQPKSESKPAETDNKRNNEPKPQAEAKAESKPEQKPQVKSNGGNNKNDRKNDKKKPQAKAQKHGERLHVEVELSSGGSSTIEKRRTVDTRGSYVDLDKYNQRYEQIAPAGKYSKDNYSTKKQKINQKSAQRNKQKYSNKRETEQDKLRRLELERARKQQLKVMIPDNIVISELAARLKVTATEVIKRLMLLGVMASINEEIDFDTASLVAEELGAKVEKEVIVTIEERLIEENDDIEDTEERCPVVCVMGHVDHGKTSILDRIRNAHVTDGEAGGITQHIGAYQVVHDGKPITFLDTPGHEAFTAMRARGANITDIAILVVAADDGIMPQTVESISHAKAAGVSVIVAINKMDKEGANPDRVKEELTKYDMVCEDWGGDVICVPVSAKTGEGIDELLENVLLIAEMQELKANSTRRAKGTVVEARLDKGRGPIATLLVQNGTLHTGDVLIAGTTVGRVRVMTNDKGQVVNSAGPSVPVEITGMAEVPEAGDTFNAVEDERLAKTLVEQRKHEAKQAKFGEHQKVTLDNLFSQIEEGEMKELDIVVKADVQGSVEAVKQSLEKLSNDEVRVRVIHGGVGGIKESDVMLASASNAIIIGFNVRPDLIAEETAARDNVEIRTYRVIYDAIEDVETAMKGMLDPKYREVVMGRIEVRQVYKISNVGAVAGAYVLNGKVTRQCQIRIVRDGVVIAEDKMSSLKRFKDDVKEVAENYECGITLEKFRDFKEGDIFEAFIMEEYRD